MLTRLEVLNETVKIIKDLATRGRHCILFLAIYQRVWQL
jgi:hypothetical protein